jgi:hypothetical protein
MVGMAYGFVQITKALAGVKDKKRAPAKFDAKNMASLIGGSLITMIGIAAAITLSSLIMQYIVPVDGDQLKTAALIGLVLITGSISFAIIVRNIKGASIKQIVMASVAMGLVSAAITLSSLVMQYIVPVDGDQLKTAGLIGLVLVVGAIAFALIVRSIKRVPLKQIGMAAAAMGAIALGLTIAAYIFTYLPDEFKAPEVGWTLKAGLALFIFGISFVLVAKTIGNLKLQNILIATVAVAAIAVAILATAWIFSILPGTFLAPDIGWSLSAMASIILFAIPVGIIGAIIMATGGAGLGAISLGVVGMIIIAAGILAIAWIFSYIPADKLASVAKGLTEALLAPINGIVDVLARIKNEIGIEALVPLAVGIIAISVSLITLAAATASVAAGGLFESIAGVGTTFFGAVSEFFGGKRKKGPLEILTELVGMSPQIAILAGDMQVLTNAFVGIIGKLTESNISRLVRGVNSMILTDEMMKNKNRYSVAGYFKAYPIFLRKVASGYAAIAKAQNSMDIQVLDKTTEMIKALAYLNEVGGDNAMAKLGDALINAVKELAGMLRQLGTDINQQTAAGRETSTALTNVANQLQDTVGTTVKPQPVSTATKATATAAVKEEKLARADLANFSSDEIVDAIEELQRIIKSQRAFI